MNNNNALAHRFEIAVQNFGNACFHLKSNEKSFQAWLASFMIQEFGISRVYREVHLMKENELFLPEDKTGFAGKLSKGNELFPDLVISSRNEIDSRPSSSRQKYHVQTNVEKDYKLTKAEDLLSQLSIITELKVTCSTAEIPKPPIFRKDLEKLFVFHRTYNRAIKKLGLDDIHSLKCYLIILDNHVSAGGTFDGKVDENFVKEITTWAGQADVSNIIPKPTILVLRPQENGLGCRMDVYRD